MAKKEIVVRNQHEFEVCVTYYDNEVDKRKVFEKLDDYEEAFNAALEHEKAGAVYIAIGWWPRTGAKKVELK